MQEILLIGGGGHCKSVIDVIEQENRFKIAGIVDQKELIGSKVLGYEVIACDDDLAALAKKYDYVCITVGQIKSSAIRVKLYELVKSLGFELPVIVSPRAYVSKHTSVGEGTVVMHDVVINAGAKILHNCIINTKALIEHDCVIKENCHISTSAIVNGGVTVQKNCFIGSNATFKEYITVKENSFIKAGSIVK